MDPMATLTGSHLQDVEDMDQAYFEALLEDHLPLA